MKFRQDCFIGKITNFPTQYLFQIVKINLKFYIKDLK